MNVISSRECFDNNPKTVLRKYDWDGKLVEISLCAQHQKDPDFSHFESEEKIQ
jgi:hypothetical protein